MSRRTEQVLDRFVPGPNGGHFVIGTAPLSPDVKRERVVNHVNHTETERIFISLACPHCKRDVDIEYDAGEVPLNFAQREMRRLERERNDQIGRLMEWGRQLAEREAPQRQNIVASMQIEAMEDWYA